MTAVEQSALVVLEGGAETGKSILLRTLAIQQEGPLWVVHVDLDGAYSAERLAWLWWRANGRALAGGIAFSHAVSLPESMWPASTRRALLGVDERLGSAAAIALSESPPHDGVPMSHSLGDAIAATSRISQEKPVLLIIDHLEAPLLTPRHPVKLPQLLWQLRAAYQRNTNVRVVLGARRGMVESISSRDAAFFGDGRWVHATRPSVATWEFAIKLALGKRLPALAEIHDLTEGHVATMMDVITRSTNDPDESHAAAQQVTFRLAFDELVHAAGPLVARSIQHARTLDRLGGHILQALARGLGPYEATPGESSRDVQRAVNRLHLAGLVDRNEPRRWRVLNPVVATALRGGRRFDEAFWQAQSGIADQVATPSAQ
jgi:hypothetical protein